MISQGLIFTGISYLLVYIGAIAILFLFVIMLMDTRNILLRSNRERRLLAFILGLVVYFVCVLPEKVFTL
jgi:NADH-ubiquinone oxidoreductase chain 6